MVNDEEAVPCETCGNPMEKLFPCTRRGLNGVGEKFTPFWSDTFEMRVNDREDLSRLKDLRKKHGLECVGHRGQTPDKSAIRKNYESE
jgi:hypothetical protein